MSRNPGAKPAQILYIGREDSRLREGVAELLSRRASSVAFARTQTPGTSARARTSAQYRRHQPHQQPFLRGAPVQSPCVTRLPQARRVVLVDRGEGKQIEARSASCRPFTAQEAARYAHARCLTRWRLTVLRVGPIELDISHPRRPQPSRDATHLTPKQCHLLAIFMQRPNQVISREDLMREIWDTHYLGDTRTLDVHIRWLREKIEADPTQPDRCSSRSARSAISWSPGSSPAAARPRMKRSSQPRANRPRL